MSEKPSSFIEGGRGNYLKGLREREAEDIAPYEERLKTSRDRVRKRWIKKRIRVIKRKYQRLARESGDFRF
ncbi:MAG: hypothetical protein H6751_12575 [Candidatus Omnitrophica bacterium]|nr:hypothetical protein [Candidatus Omnitrophota bacterium]MCB9783790.1 hypothetical protein [Candidatus Omnitrophota bacterium]